MSSFRYKVFYGDSLCKVYNDDCKYILNMFKKEGGNSCPVDTGGEITLLNDDILYINEKMGIVDPWQSGDEYEGIGLALDSGDTFIVYCYMPSYNRFQESGYGAIFDYPENRLYVEGTLLKIYDVEGYDWYELSDNYNIFYREDGMARASIPCIGIIKLEDDEWVMLDSSSSYYGTTVTLNSGEEIFISGISMEDGAGVYFTRDSGYQSISYYYRDGDLVNQSSFGYFGECGEPQEDDEIHIYDYGDNYYDDPIWDGHNPWQEHIDFSDEEMVSEYMPLLCVLKFDGDSWYADEDYSDD